jgi:nicotinate dehydrogenase subunit A
MSGPAPRQPVRFHVNGVLQALAVDPDARLLHVLRQGLGLKATREGCGAGQCGACHVLVDGRSQAACGLPMWAVEGRHVTTADAPVDAAAAGPRAAGEPAELAACLGRLRRSFADHQAAQCGYCLSGVLVTAAALLAGNASPTAAQVRQALDGHLCRCGAHNRIVRAVLAAGSGPRKAAE